MEKSKIDRINELARKQKSVGLTDEEKAEQKTLREEYLSLVKRNLTAQLDNTYIMEPDGTKHKAGEKK